MKVFEEKSGRRFRTNYIDHYNGVIFNGKKLIKFEEVIDVDLKREDALQVPFFAG